MLDALHGEGRADVGQLDGGDEALVDRVVAGDVGHHDAHQVVDVAAHAVELDDLGDGGDRGGERLEPGGVVLVGPDVDENGDAEVEFVGVQERDAAGDDAVALEPLDAVESYCEFPLRSA